MLTKRRAGAAVKLATVGPVGYFPIAPGTAGAVVGVALTVALHRCRVHHWASSVGIVAAVIYVAGVWAASRAERAFGVTDPSHVVIDEVAGQCVAFILQPAGGWAWLLGGFILFRVFDVLKPFPARRSERLPEGWGIMTDDIVAGGYSAVVLFLLRLVFR
ncbi:MAG: phosphatidylglycerophosphatase A family protein [Terriglobia bacterium]